MSENDDASETGTIVEPAVTAKLDEPVMAETVIPVPTAKKHSRGRSIFVLLLDVLVLIAVAALGYGYWQQKRALDILGTRHAALEERIANSGGQFTSLQDSQQQLESSQQQMESSLQQMESSLQAMQQQLQQTLAQQQQNQQQAQQQLQAQLAESTSRLAGLAAQLNAVNSELATTRQQVSQLGSQTADDVVLNEAASLIELAQQHLRTARDVKAATTLLINSDDLLARIESIDVTAARTVLDADLAALKAVPEVNISALYQQLATVSSQVNVMTVIAGTDNPRFAVPQSGAAEPKESGWLDNALSALGEYFVVTRQDVEVVPLLTAEQQFLLRQNIELQLASAQLALLNAEPEVYRTALAAARDGIDKWLQSSDDSKATLLTTVNMLEETSIVVAMPDISASLNAIRQLSAVTPSSLPLPATAAPGVVP